MYVLAKLQKLKPAPPAPKEVCLYTVCCSVLQRVAVCCSVCVWRSRRRCVYNSMYICMYTHLGGVYMLVCIYICILVSIYVFLSVYVFMYIHINTYTFMYIHINTYIYSYSRRLWQKKKSMRRCMLTRIYTYVYI